MARPASIRAGCGRQSSSETPTDSTPLFQMINALLGHGEAVALAVLLAQTDRIALGLPKSTFERWYRVPSIAQK